MKTAISIPNDLFESAERLAKDLGLSRSELYANAIRRYVRERSGEEITAQLDEIYGVEEDDLDSIVARLQGRSTERRMVMRRGEVWWTELREPIASEPGYRRPVLVVQSDDFNRSRIRTVIAAILTTNLKLAAAPGNVMIAAGEAGLHRDSVVNVSQIVTMDKTFLTERAGEVDGGIMSVVERGIRTVLSL